MSIILDEAQAYENSRDYDCCQIIEEDYTVGDAVYEAYCDGRKVPVTDVEIEAAAKYLKANPGLFGPSACFIDPNRFRGNRAKCAPSRQKRSRKGHGMSYRISLDGTDRTFQDIADAAEYARQLSLELNGSVVKVFDAETGLVIFTAKSRAKIED